MEGREGRKREGPPVLPYTPSHYILDKGLRVMRYINAIDVDNENNNINKATRLALLDLTRRCPRYIHSREELNGGDVSATPALCAIFRHGPSARAG